MRRSPRKNIQTRKTNKMNRQEASNHSSSIEDLNAPDPEAIKGGLSTQIKRIVILKSSVNQAETAEDEPVRGFTLNHNETLAEEEDVEAEVLNHNETTVEDEPADEPSSPLADLPVTSGQEAQVAGGGHLGHVKVIDGTRAELLLPVVQKVR
jgi:hypothetical protein